MVTIAEDMKNINKFKDALRHAQNCIVDTREEILEHELIIMRLRQKEINIAHDFLLDAEKYLKLTMEKNKK